MSHSTENNRMIPRLYQFKMNAPVADIAGEKSAQMLRLAQWGPGLLIVIGVMALPLQAQSLEDLEQLRKRLEAGAIIDEQLPNIQEDIIGEAADIAVLEQAETEVEDVPPGHFGYNFFSDRARVELFENLPAPANYQLGPGDEIVISLWGDSRLRSNLTISRNGTIYIGEVGLVSLADKSLAEAQVYLKSKFSQVYATLRGPNPTTFLEVSLGDLKLINVTFLGEVNNPGVHAIHPFSRGITGLIQAGGIAITGSLRNIRIIRDSNVITSIDLYAYLLEGSAETDIQLLDQDIIFVPVRYSSISVEGKIRRPSVYEALPGENLADMLKYSGGRTPDAGKTIEITRITDIVVRTNDDDALSTMYVPITEVINTPLIDGDIIFMREILPIDKEVYIYGQVKRAGTYGFQKSMKLLDLMELAGGIHDESYWKSVYTARAELIRRNVDSDYATTIPIDLNALRDGDESANIELENLDQVIIRSNPYYDAPRNVTVLGEVEVPGVYAISRDGQSLEEVFERAGGFTSSAFQEGIRMQRGGIRVILSDYGIAVAEGDSIVVPIHPGVVQVRGEVYTPGLIHYSPELNLSDYIESAGGYNLTAAEDKISVTYANGNVKLKRRFRSPKIEEGAIIEIHQKQESVPFNSTEFAANLAQIVASTATLLLAYISATPSN